MVFIQDPVAKMHYVLEPENRTVRKVKIGQDEMERAPIEGKKVERWVEAAPHGA